MDPKTKLQRRISRDDKQVAQQGVESHGGAIQLPVPPHWGTLR